MKFVTKQLEMEAEVIVKVEPVVSNTKGTYEVTTDTGLVVEIVWKEAPKEGDYLNITNPDDIYHMPKHIVEGPDAKYIPKPDVKDTRTVDDCGKALRHVTKAIINMSPSIEQGFIQIENQEDVKGVPAIVKFTIQSDPVREVGINGCQARDMLEYTKCLFQSLNSAIPNRETSITITKLEEALHWQDARTADREKRKVEGSMKE